MLYHASVFLPRKIRGCVPKDTKSVLYSFHAQSAAKTDKYGKIPLHPWYNFADGEIIEVEYYERTRHVAKLVFRFKHDDRLDIVIALSPTGDKSTWFARTVWFNEKNDSHVTLDPTPYAKAS